MTHYKHQGFNPASAGAVTRGCTCSPELNHHGEGMPINDGANRRWTIKLYCPLHSEWVEPNPEG
jgi:hypothetical protein